MLNEQTVLDILAAKKADNEERIYELVNNLNNLNILDECRADFYAQLVDAESLDDLAVRTLYNSSLIFGTTGIRA